MSTIPSSLASSIYHPIQSIPSNLFGPNDFSSIIDPEIVRDNPVEAKHRRLVRSHRNGPLDRELKPNAKIRDELNVRPSLPPSLPLLTQHNTGDPPLSSNPDPHLAPKRSRLAIPFLSHSR